MSKKPFITITTDFGLCDGYDAAMKGVIYSICPDAIVVDISHQINKFDIMHGALVIASTASDFPKGTVHIGVIDPGVGTSRRGIAIKTKNYVFVGPDNGLFSLAAELDGIEAIYELKKGEVPPKVVIDESIELAKEFGGENSPPFINGVLGTILKELNIDIEKSITKI